jgi:hypothetical protein
VTWYVCDGPDALVVVVVVVLVVVDVVVVVDVAGALVDVVVVDGAVVDVVVVDDCGGFFLGALDRAASATDVIRSELDTATRTTVANLAMRCIRIDSAATLST